MKDSRVGEKHSFTCFLDIDEKHPELFGECLLPRDDDGMGFALNLSRFRGRHCRVTVEIIDEDLPLPEWQTHTP